MNVSADDGQWSSDQKKKEKKEKKGRRKWKWNEIFQSVFRVPPPRPHFSAMDERGIRQAIRSALSTLRSSH